MTNSGLMKRIGIYLNCIQTIKTKLIATKLVFYPFLIISNIQKEQDAVQSCELGGRVLILQEKIKARIGRRKYENRKEMFSMVAKLLDHEEEVKL